MVIRLIPKGETGNLSPNDLIALLVVVSLAGDAVVGNGSAMLEVVLVVVVVLVWDYAFNLIEFYCPRFRRIAQDSPTLVIHNGKVLKQNLRKEKLTDEELAASLRKKGVTDMTHVRQAVLEVDGEITVIEKDKS